MVRITSATLIAFAAGAIGAPQGTFNRRQSPGGCDAPVKLDASTNVFESYKLHANSFYRSEVEAAAEQMEGEAAEAALRVADIGTFLWA
jgi:cellulose 1,4-beta-cellobiosidase